MSVSDKYHDRVRALSPAKALALGAYGEAVASYRYRTLAEKTPTPSHKPIFEEMAEEEHGHHRVLAEILSRQYPDSDFVLTPEDKELVIVGPRMFEVTDHASADHALDLIHRSECLTGRFYEAFHDVTAVSILKPLLKEMAAECFEHAERIKGLRAAKQS